MFSVKIWSMLIKIHPLNLVWFYWVTCKVLFAHGYLFVLLLLVAQLKETTQFLTAGGDLWCVEGKCMGHGYKALVKHTCTLYCLHNGVSECSQKFLLHTQIYNTTLFTHILWSIFGREISMLSGHYHTTVSRVTKHSNSISMELLDSCCILTPETLGL